MTDLNSGNAVKKPMISKKFFIGVLAFAGLAFFGVLGSIFLKESLDQSAAAKTATQATNMPSERPGLSGGPAPSAPSSEPEEATPPSEPEGE